MKKPLKRDGANFLSAATEQIQMNRNPSQMKNRFELESRVVLSSRFATRIAKGIASSVPRSLTFAQYGMAKIW